MIQRANPIDSDCETDSRFPSGQWTGFFLQPQLTVGRNWMSLFLSFTYGQIKGSGDDWVGEFILKGHYDLTSGEVMFNKKYLGQHDVFYSGFADGTSRGIWGTWEIEELARGGWHIWPRGTGDPTRLTVAEEADVPQAVLVTNGFNEPF